MQSITPQVALYFHTLGLREDEPVVIRRTYNYCKENQYTFQSIYKDTGMSKPIFREMKQAMKNRAFQILCIPSLLQVHCSHIGQVLHFLQDAQNSQVEIICLYPRPINIFQQNLTLLPAPAQRHLFDLGDIVRYLRLSSKQ
ncbi:hypothetical protein [Dictyobacter kobayashii]|uniref:Resolvase/invertase-type recombinase catalytic domain-containing protein n=1 Tax=Dictyobacter kobayashii TaxID=2014872 RepID=A0A402AVW0_9CHLR|nr:hypothetical protein [Dictyobacter kobayashii]GCE23261.1 hypothetical protein KDK_70610 [Dictyobacter kobayashii]